MRSIKYRRSVSSSSGGQSDIAFAVVPCPQRGAQERAEAVGQPFERPQPRVVFGQNRFLNLIGQHPHKRQKIARKARGAYAYRSNVSTPPQIDCQKSVSGTAGSSFAGGQPKTQTPRSRVKRT